METDMRIFTEFCPVRYSLFEYAGQQGLLTQFPEEADFILLPFPYEYIHDYKSSEFERIGLSPQILPELKVIARRLDDLSEKMQKPLIVTFYRDPSIELPLKNALVFRTSAFFHKNQTRQFGLPAFLEELSDDPGFCLRNKMKRASVSFRGAMAPINLSLLFQLRQLYNNSLGSLIPVTRQKLWYNEGYMLRRKAVLSLLKENTRLAMDLRINPSSNTPDYDTGYHRSFFDNDYFLCVAGHGNYSYRLYETMRAGRIPVFIDTNCLLPCADVINWKELLIWIDKADVSRTAEILLDFHASIRPDDFLALQRQIRKTWEEYLSLDGFARYLFEQALPAKLEVS